MDKENILAGEYKSFFLKCLYLLFALCALNFLLYSTEPIIHYSLLVLFLLIAVGISAVLVIPNGYSLRLVPVFISLLMLLLFPLSSFLLFHGNCVSLFWYFVIIVFLHTVYQGKVFLWWAGGTLLLLLLSFASALVLRYLLLDDAVLYWGAIGLYGLLEPIMLNSIFAFLFVALSMYYSQRLNQKEIKELQSLLHWESQKKEKEQVRSDLKTEHKYALIYKQIEAYFANGQPYLNRNFKIGKMAHDLNINAPYLSKAIQNNSKLSFCQYVNRYRVEHVKKLMQNSNQKYTLEYIFLASGFANQSSFNKAFKQMEGITPSEFLNTDK